MYLNKGTPYVERSKLACWYSKPMNKSANDKVAMAKLDG